MRLSVSNSSSSATFASFFYYLSELQKKKTHTHTHVYIYIYIYIYIYMLVFIKLQCDRFCQQFYVMLREERKEKKSTLINKARLACCVFLYWCSLAFLFAI